MTDAATFVAEPELFAALPVAAKVRARVASPQDGISLERAVGEKGRHLREAVHEIARALGGLVSQKQFDAAFGPRFHAGKLPQLPPSRIAWRAAW